MTENRENSSSSFAGEVILARLKLDRYSDIIKSYNKPFDPDFICFMIKVAKHLCKGFSCTFAYTQFGEINLVWDRANSQVQLPIIKINKLNNSLIGTASGYYSNLNPKGTIGVFDCETWKINTRREAIETIIWRQLDAKVNSIHTLARHYFLETELIKKNLRERLQLLDTKGIKWGDLPREIRQGTFIVSSVVERPLLASELQLFPENMDIDPLTIYYENVYECIHLSLKDLSPEEINVKLFNRKSRTLH